VDKLIKTTYTYESVEEAIVDSENISYLYRENNTKVDYYQILIGKELVQLVYFLKILEI